MPKTICAVSRRLALKTFAASAFVAGAPMGVLAGEGQAEALLFTLADLHAPYARLPALLERVEQIVARERVPAAMLINGDIFERGNVVCARSQGAADWAFIEALSAQMPVVINLGNHETAVLDDMATFVARAEQAGARVISNLIDTRTDRFFAPFATRIGLGGMRVGLLGLGATNPFVYRKPVRDTLAFLDTASFVADASADVLGGVDQGVVMSHAGLGSDKAFIGALPDGTLLQGAHDHLSCEFAQGATRYFHGASWGTSLGVVRLKRAGGGVVSSLSFEPIRARSVAGDLADFIDEQSEAHLLAEDREVIAQIPRDFDLHDSILLGTEALREATEADVAMIGHTTFGAPLSSGPLTRHEYAGYLRFGGPVAVADISGARLQGLLSRTNQFAARRLAERSGDYLHVAALDVDPARSYRVAVNGWTAKNQKAYLGTTDLDFQTVDGLELRGLIAAHLAKRFS